MVNNVLLKSKEISSYQDKVAVIKNKVEMFGHKMSGWKGFIGGDLFLCVWRLLFGYKAQTIYSYGVLFLHFFITFFKINLFILRILSFILIHYPWNYLIIHLNLLFNKLYYFIKRVEREIYNAKKEVHEVEWGHQHAHHQHESACERHQESWKVFKELWHRLKGLQVGRLWQCFKECCWEVRVGVSS